MAADVKKRTFFSGPRKKISGPAPILIIQTAMNTSVIVNLAGKSIRQKSLGHRIGIQELFPQSRG
jgi:hypothetical protein